MAQVARRATASSTSCALPSTTTIRGEPTAEHWARSLPSWRTEAASACRTSAPLDVRDYLDAAKADGLSTATLKQHMAAIRMLFDHLVTGAVLEHNPACRQGVSVPAISIAERVHSLTVAHVCLRAGQRGAADFYPDHHAVGALGRLNIDPSFAAPKADMVRLEAFRLG
jgi:Phage integrase, N-terminal SAM-like domain